MLRRWDIVTIGNISRNRYGLLNVLPAERSNTVFARPLGGEV